MTAPATNPSADLGEGAARKHLVWMLVSLAYLVLAPYFPRINNPNENVRIWMTRAIVEDHSLALDRTSAVWGYVDDKATDQGHLYSSKAPGTSLLGVPVLWAQTKLWHAFGWPSPSKRATTFGLRFFSVVPCVIAFLFVFARWIERRTRSPAARDLLLVAVGLGTMIYPYGILFVGHAQGALAAFAAFMALGWHDGPRAPLRRHLILAGALAGTAVLFEYQLLLVALVLAGLALWRARRHAGWFALGALPPALALGAYHMALFGRPWAFPYGHLENQTYAHLHHGSGFFGLGPPQPAALSASLFSVSYGLFVFSPFLLLGLAGAVKQLKSPARTDALAILLSSVMLLLFLAGMTHWRAGWCVGPRYIAGCAPFLAAGLLMNDRMNDRLFDRGPADDNQRANFVLRVLLGGSIVASVFINGVSAATYPHYPEAFDNPLFDLALPLWRDGYVPSGLGHALGLPRGWALLPPALLWIAALVLAIAGPARRLRAKIAQVGGAALMAALLLTLLSRYGRAPAAAEQHATSVVRALWDPAPRP